MVSYAQILPMRGPRATCLLPFVLDSMENRRQFYRHAFALTYQFAVRLQSADGAVTLHAESINLSTGGMYVYAPALRTQSADRWIATISLATNAEPLIVAAERVHPPDG